MRQIKSPLKIANSTKKAQIYMRVQVGNGYWLTAHAINEILNWDAERLRKARERGEINYRRDERGELLYDLKSIPADVLELLKKRAS
jgi:hypothetical protein